MTKLILKKQPDTVLTLEKVSLTGWAEQQAYNRTPVGFLNKFQTQTITQTSARLTLRLVKSWYNEWAKKFNLFIQSEKLLFNSSATLLTLAASQSVE